jgi:hypothetical protein
MIKNEYKLFQVVSENSESDNLEDMIKEWEIVGYEKEENSQCICGKKHILDVYKIRNKLNTNYLYPVGSKCIQLFENDDMNHDIKILNNKFKIFNNKGKRYDGLTYDDICRNHPDYVRFLKTCDKKNWKWSQAVLKERVN